MHGLIGSLAHCPPISNVQVDRRYLERPGNVCIDGPQVRGLELGSGTWTGECQHRACYPHSTSEPKLTPTSTIRTKRAWPCCENSPRPPRHTAQNASPSLAMQVGGGCLDLGIGYECVKMPSLVSYSSLTFALLREAEHRNCEPKPSGARRYRSQRTSLQVPLFWQVLGLGSGSKLGSQSKSSLGVYLKLRHTCYKCAWQHA